MNWSERELEQHYFDALEKARRFKSIKEIKDFNNFVERMKIHAPFNAWLLYEQNQDLTYAMSENDWFREFGMKPKKDARPLVILNFNPCGFLYQKEDIDGDLPHDYEKRLCPKSNPMESEECRKKSEKFTKKCKTKIIDIEQVASKDLNPFGRYTDFGQGGHDPAQEFGMTDFDSYENRFKIRINIQKSEPEKLATLIHELSHIFLGHFNGHPQFNYHFRKKLKKNQNLKILEREDEDFINDRHSELSEHVREVEAEMISWLICKRIGIEVRPEKYLGYHLEGIEASEGMIHLDKYYIMSGTTRVLKFLNLE